MKTSWDEQLPGLHSYSLVRVSNNSVWCTGRCQKRSLSKGGSENGEVLKVF